MSVPFWSNWVAKLWRRVWGETRFGIPLFRANNLSEHLNGSSRPGAACQCSITGTEPGARPDRMDEVKAVRRVVWDPGANHSRGPD